MNEFNVCLTWKKSLNKNLIEKKMNSLFAIIDKSYQKQLKARARIKKERITCIKRATTRIWKMLILNVHKTGKSYLYGELRSLNCALLCSSYFHCIIFWSTFSTHINAIILIEQKKYVPFCLIKSNLNSKIAQTMFTWLSN